jgi:chromosome segregation ATPase
MNEPQSARSGLRSARKNDDPADAAILLKLQQTAALANENCDRATALVRTLSSQLREAQQRIAQLEREAKGRLEAQTAFAQLQAEFDACIGQAKREVEERLNHKLAEAKADATRLQVELLQARQRATEATARIERINKEADERVARAELGADERIAQAGAEIQGVFVRLKGEAAEAREQAERAQAEADRIRREANEQIRRAEWDAEKSLEQLRAEARGEVTRLQIELAAARKRAERAEEWLVRIRHEVEGRLLRAFTRPRNGPAETKVD